MPAEIVIPARQMFKRNGGYYCANCAGKTEPAETVFTPVSASVLRECYECGYKARPNATYNLVRTNAPAAYDGFGTFTHKWIDPIDQDENTPYMLQGKSYRVIAVLPESMQWQESRNRSGLHCFIPLEEGEEI